MQKITLGKKLGLVIFYFLLLCFSITIMCELFGIENNMIKICELVIKVFFVVFGSVFGSGITKKIVNKGQDNEESNNNPE